MKNSSESRFASDISLSQSELPSSEHIIGEIVMELLRTGKTISKYAICLSIVSRIDAATTPQMEAHLYQVLGLIFRADSYSTP
ncbi:two-component-system connector protein YcgZ [Atlantibacter hermannii]|nr:two-component-system connector protein YcgZ [Atlantibacter hermannii]NBD00029.1 two-component-system connector protein YcgZ [Atlantibacter hermannii]